MKNLTQQIRDHIQTAGGWIPFSDYMQQALYTPELGYYCQPEAIIGREGDFITAPEISPLFSRCLANYCEPIIQACEKPILMEIGAGRGTMAAEIITALSHKDALPNAYWILEISPALRQRQQQHLQKHCPDFYPNIQWLDQAPTSPFEGVILGNEVLDALPIQRFCVQDNRILEMGVSLDADQFIWQSHSPQTPGLEKAVQTMLDAHSLAEGYCSEIAVGLADWHKTMTQQLAKGTVLWLDYGHAQKDYYHPDRQEGTLHCHYQHQVQKSPFIAPGQQDITADVNFTAVATSAVAQGFELEGYTNQMMFLTSCGLMDLLAEQQQQHPEQTAKWSQQCQHLTHPTMMGEKFKVLALSKNWDDELLGFQFADLSHQL